MKLSEKISNVQTKHGLTFQSWKSRCCNKRIFSRFSHCLRFTRREEALMIYSHEIWITWDLKVVPCFFLRKGHPQTPIISVSLTCQAQPATLPPPAATCRPQSFPQMFAICVLKLGWNTFFLESIDVAPFLLGKRVKEQKCLIVGWPQQKHENS